MTPRTPWLILAAIALAGAAGVQGYRLGYEASQTTHAVQLARAQTATIRAAELASALEAQRLTLLAERNALALELEDTAHADATAGRAAFSADSMRRLNRR